MPREDSFTHDVGTGGDGSGLVRCFAGQDGHGDLGSPTLATLGINVYDSLGECACKHNPSLQGMESPNFKSYWQVRIAVEAQLQCGPGAPESPDEAVERLVSRGPDIGIYLEHEERDDAVALAKTVENAVTNGLSAGGEVRLRKILDLHWNAF